LVIVRLASARESLPGCPLLTDAPVYSLAQQVGVTVVARVLLDHVNQELSQGDWLAGAVVSDVGAMPRIRHNTMLAGPRAPPQTGVSDDWIYD